MNNWITCPIVFICTICLQLAVYGQWTQMNDFPTSDFSVDAVSIRTSAYVVTSNYKLNIYDPSSDSWQEQDVPWAIDSTSRAHMVTMAINDKLYVGGGVIHYPGPPPNNVDTLVHEFYEYDPITQNWTQRASIPLSLRFSSLRPVPFVVNNVGYIFDNSSQVYAYDPVSDAWDVVSTAFPNGSGHFGHTSFVIDDLAYIGGGFHFEGMASGNSFFSYDPVANEWQRISDYPANPPRSQMTSFVIQDMGYVGLGFYPEGSGKSYDEQFYQYAPATDTWTQIEDCGYIAEEAFSFTLGDRGYVGAGVAFNQGSLESPLDVWSYTDGPVSTNETNKHHLVDIRYVESTNSLVLSNYKRDVHLSFALYDLYGRAIVQDRVSGAEINLPAMHSGLYVVRLNQAGRSAASTTIWVP